MWWLWKLLTVFLTLQCNWNIRDLINSETCHHKPSAEVVSSWWFPGCDFLFMLCCPISFAPLLQFLHFILTKYHYCGNSLWHKTELRTFGSDFFPSSQPLFLYAFLIEQQSIFWVNVWLTNPFEISATRSKEHWKLVSLCPHVVVSWGLSVNWVTPFPLENSEKLKLLIAKLSKYLLQSSKV